MNRLFLIQMQRRTEQDSYRLIPLVELIRRIVEDNDQTALMEFHDRRTCFHFYGNPSARFSEYLAYLRTNSCEATWGLAIDCAYDRTMDKFSRMENDSGIDCRRYYQSLLISIHGRYFPSELHQEEALTHNLNRFVYHHFKFSLRDCKRQLSSQNRYQWDLPNGSLTLHFPRSFGGTDRKAWLEEHVSNPDPNRPGESDRIQRLIDESFEAASGGTPVDLEQLPAEDSFAWEELDTHVFRDLAETVATEKSATYLEQRKAIQALGPDRVYELVLRVFDNVCNPGSETDTQICKQFGLSKATFSRFAGQNWDTAIPDLWENTARIVGQSPIFREALEK